MGIKKVVRSESGQSIVLIAIVMIGLLALVGLALDGGRLFVQRRETQNAADTSALAGAQTLAQQQLDSSIDEAALFDQIQQVAGRNQVQDPASSIIAYYTDINGDPILVDGDPVPVGAGDLNTAAQADGLEINIDAEFDAAFVGLIGIDRISTSAEAAAVFTLGGDGGGGYVIWADSHDCGKKWTLSSAGSTKHFDGNIHSNQGLSLTGSENVVTGVAEYVSVCHDPRHQLDCVRVSPSPMPLSFNIDDYRPGGRAAVAAGDDYHHVTGNLHLPQPDDLQGLYYVEGDVHINGSSVNATALTLVSEGTMHLNGSELKFYPYVDDLLFFSNEYYPSNACSQWVVKLSGSSHDWQGIVYAPRGQVFMSGASNISLHGAILAWAVSLSGSYIDISYGGDHSPPEIEHITLIR